MQTIARSAVRRLASAPLRLLGLELRRLPSEQTDQFERVYSKYRDRTMLGREEYIANLRLSSTVRAQGCVIECGVWKGGTIAGMAEVLGADREYFLFDSFQGHLDPQPIDGPAALAWKEDKEGPWYFDNAVVGTEDAERAMLSSGAKSFKLVKGWFEDTLPHFVPPSPIAVLRIDCDWYASAMTCLRALFPYLSDEGILIADGYPDWDGYARAIHEYLANFDGIARLKQFEGGLYYVVKGARNWATAGSRE
jgi:O-methyltransferase